MSENNKLPSLPLLMLTATFATIVISGNIFALKFTHVGGFITPAGMICFPFTYSIGDIITEVYGYKVAKRVIYIGLFCLIFFYTLLSIVITLPPAPTWNLQSEFEHIFSLSTRIFLGTIVGYVSGEILNSKILSILKYLTKGNIFIPRAISATIIGITIDTLLFNVTAFLFILPLNILLFSMMDQLLLKVTFEIFGSFIAYPIIRYIKHIDKMDVFDNYNVKWFKENNV